MTTIITSIEEIIMSIICKLFTHVAHENADGSNYFELSAVCRGDENKDWAAATPSGSLKPAKDEALSAMWAEREKGTAMEVLVRVVEDADGDYQFEHCAFTYGGCEVRFRQKSAPYGLLTLTINATPATLYLREAYAKALLAGAPARFHLEYEKP